MTLAEVLVDDALVEQLRAGATPTDGDRLTQLLSAWRDDCHDQTAPNPRT